MMSTTEQVLISHEAALSEQDAIKVSSHYAEKAIAIINGIAYYGPNEIASMYTTLLNKLHNATWHTPVVVIHEDLAYVEWTCQSISSTVKFGTDTFIVSDGVITRQTASFIIIDNDK